MRIGTSDAINQNDLASALWSMGGRDGERTAYDQLPNTVVRAHDLRNHQGNGLKEKAMRETSKRRRLQLTPDEKIPPESSHLHWSQKDHYLDLMVAVSSGLGLGAAIPNVTHDHTFHLMVNLKVRRRLFRVNHVKLGFDPTGRMLHVGKCRTEDVWLAMCPVDLITGNSDEEGVQRGFANTALSEPHYRMLVTFMAGCLSNLDSHNITCQPERMFGIPLSGAINWQEHTNLL